MQRRVLFSLFLGLVFFVWLLPTAVSATVYRDALGREVALAKSPERIVSLSPALTEILFALGVEQKIVGVTLQCDYPAAVARKKRVGDYRSPSLEAVLRTRPDLVLMDAAGSSAALAARLSRLNVKVYVVQTTGLKQTLETFRHLGRLVGTPARGRALSAALNAQMAYAQQHSVQARALFCVSLHPLVVAGPQTLPGELMAQYGLVNVVEASARRYPEWSLEALIHRGPDIIFVATMNRSAALETLQSFLPRNAVREKRVIALNPDYVFRPGPRLAAGLKQMGRALSKVSP